MRERGASRCRGEDERDRDSVRKAVACDRGSESHAARQGGANAPLRVRYLYPGHKAQGSGDRRTRVTAVLSSHWLRKLAEPLVDDVEGTPTILGNGDT